MSTNDSSLNDKKGEVTELRTLLQQSFLDKNQDSQRGVVQKVIAYMTLGIDVSPLMPEMILAANTKDLIKKKMIYLYLCAYAQSHPSLSLMAINTLQTDCLDDNPMIRGLALRSLSSLRLPDYLEYVSPIISDSLTHGSPYVRKTAAMACSKIFTLSADEVYGNGWVDKLYNMLKDSDPQVISCAVFALEDILYQEGGMAVNQEIITHLFARLKDFNEWAQCTVIDLLLRYEPTEDEVFMFLNLLDDRLKHGNSAIVLGVVKVFLKITEDMPSVHKQVFERTKAPLLTLMEGSSSIELQFVCLNHLSIMIPRADSGLFINEFKHFYCKENDPTYVKTLKLKILTQIAGPSNMHEIIAELTAYATDVDQIQVRKSIEAIAEIGMKVNQVVDHCLENLLAFLELNMEYVSAVTVMALKDVLRVYPSKSTEVIPVIKETLKTLDEPAAKAAMIWMLGEYGTQIEDSPYILEGLVEQFSEQPVPVRLQLLTSTVKLFFSRAPECHPILGKLFKFATNDNHTDVRDRLLHHDIKEAERVICGSQKHTISLKNENQAELEDRIFEEFNTLAVVYGEPSENFLKNNEIEEEDEEEYEDQEYEDEYEYDYEEEDYSTPSLNLKQNPLIKPADFQSNWQNFSTVSNLQGTFPFKPQTPKDAESYFVQRSLGCVASGGTSENMKLFLFGQQDDNDAYFLIEVNLTTSTQSLKSTIKSQDASLHQDFIDYFSTIIPN